jgi:hypothetical protein
VVPTSISLAIVKTLRKHDEKLITQLKVCSKKVNLSANFYHPRF